MTIYYHYCTLDTFTKILKNDSLLLVDPKKLNDPEEMRWFCKGIIKELDKKLYKNLSYEFFLDEYLHNEPHIFIKCFCEEGDSLNMWRGYTKNLDGVSIGFDIDEMIKERKMLEFKKVKYIDIKNISDIDKKEIKEFIKSIKQDSLVLHLDEIIEKSLEYKNNFWKDEKEHRIIYKLNGSFSLTEKDFFIKDDDMVSYYALKNIKKYIKEIIIGPRCKLEENELRDKINHYICDIEIRKSDGIVV